MSAAPIDLALLPRSAALDPAGRLIVGGCDVAGLAERFGTPLYVYDEGELRARCREYAAAFGAEAVSYASKAFLCTAMAPSRRRGGAAGSRWRAAVRPSSRCAPGSRRPGSRSTETTSPTPSCATR